MEIFVLFVFIMLFVGVVCGCFCLFIAHEKNRDRASWLVLGFFFSIFALIAIAGLPIKLRN